MNGATAPAPSPSPLPPPAPAAPARQGPWRRAAALFTTPRRAGDRSRPSLALCLLLGLFSAFLIHSMPGRPFDALEWKLFDQRLRWRNFLSPRPISDRILILGIDGRDHYLFDEDLRSRRAYLELLQTLRPHGLEAVVFDILFLSRRPFDDLFGAALADTPVFLATAFESRPFDRRPEGPIPEDMAPVLEKLEAPLSQEAAWRLIETLQDYRDRLEALSPRLERLASGDPARLEQQNRLAWLRYLEETALEIYYTARFSAPVPDLASANPFEAQSLALPQPALTRAAAGAGFITVQKAGEEIVRRLPLVYVYKNRIYPSLDLLVALHYYGATFQECEIRFGEAVSFPIHRHGEGVKRIPIDARGLYLVNFRQAQDYLSRPANRTLSFYIHPQYAPIRAESGFEESLRGAILLAGETASGTTDVQPIPLVENFPLVGVHANALDNILKDDYLRLLPAWAEVLLSLVLCLAVGLAFAARDSREAGRVSLLLLILYLLGAFAVFLYTGTLAVPVVRAATSSLFAFVLLTLYVVGVTERDRRLVKEVFLKSVSPRIGEEILRRFHDPSLWASRRAVTVLFVDIRGFTPLSERLSPERLVETLDQYYDTVSEIIFRHDGQVNKFIGDAVMALFGALPGESPDHVRRALRAAREIPAAAARIRIPGPEDETGGGLNLPVGVGVNTGDAVVGAVGRRKIRIEYTALGDVVNTAERLQGRAPAGRIYVGGETVRALRAASSAPSAAGEPEAGADPEFRFRRIEGVPLKGKTREVEVYELITGMAAGTREEPEGGEIQTSR